MVPWCVVSWFNIQGSFHYHNFLRFLPVLCEQISFFFKKCYDANFTKISGSLNKKTPMFCKHFWRKYFQNRNVGPRSYNVCTPSSFIPGFLKIHTLVQKLNFSFTLFQLTLLRSQRSSWTGGSHTLHRKTTNHGIPHLFHTHCIERRRIMEFRIFFTHIA
jgi:hypothetical protein